MNGQITSKASMTHNQYVPPKDDQSLLYEEVTIPVPWGKIAAKWWGSRDRQPVIAIHGWQDNAGTFDNLAELLVAQDISVLCIDLPGHGLSSHYPKGMFYYIFWDGVHILRRIVKFYNWKRIQIMGHSLGGGIAFLYASIYPGDVDRYISLDIASPAVRDLEKFLDKSGDVIDKFYKYENLSENSVPCYGYDEMIDIVFNGYNGSVTKESCKIMMKRGMYPFGNGTFRFSRDNSLKVAGLAMMDIHQANIMAKKITCMVMNIKAVPGYSWENPEYYDMILDTIKKHSRYLETHVVEGTHHVHLNNAERISNLVAGFLKVDLKNIVQIKSDAARSQNGKIKLETDDTETAEEAKEEN